MPKVVFPAKLSSKLYKRAKKAFPNEEYAILIGKRLKNKDFEVVFLYFPTERLNDQHPEHVNVDQNWFETAHEMALTFGLEVLGDIHSHCYDVYEEGGNPGTDPSEADWEWAEEMKNISGGKYRLLGIVRVLKKGDKVSCRARFWPAMDLPIIIK